MNTLRKIVMPAIGVLAVLAFQAIPSRRTAPRPALLCPAAWLAPPRPDVAGRGSTPDHPHSLAPYFTPATSSPKAPDTDGFLQRWLLLEPINKPNRTNTVFTDSYMRNAINTEYFPDQFTVVPHDGDKVTVAGQELAWHAWTPPISTSNFFASPMA